MTTPQSDTEDHKDKKFGIPSWMVQNIERLNATTDFEQYAYLPETEGFLADCPITIENLEIAHSSNVTDEKCYMTKSVSDDVKKSFEDQRKFVSELKLASKLDALHKPLSQRHQSFLDVLKCDDVVYSSPDTTPQPSPAPQRKISFKKTGTVQSNPEKWFYLGAKEKNKMQLLKEKNECQHLQTLTDMRKKSDENHTKAKMPVRDTNVKLAISNFDLNALSPSSW